ncbi:hypothetical protein [Mangrovimonas sp. TPBH4]|uniref:hypothetical protein n=1 Tax=Mangrovimonas sp. TPBH4 TaxID=1645914 RepID=UPI0012F99207|nr:hypothetical protein [Mangrovimonas sp. TPBH4]
MFNCSSEDSSNDNDPNNGNGGDVLKSVKTYSSGILQSIMEFEYNSYGDIVQQNYTDGYGETVEAEFFYDENNKLTHFTEVYTDAWGDVTNEINEFTFEGELITQICIEETEEDGDVYNDKIVFTYNGNGFATMIEHYSRDLAEDSDCSTLEYVDTTELIDYNLDGNMTQYQNDSFTFFGELYYTYTYDDKNHPYKNVEPEAYRKILGYSTNNNIVQNVEFDLNTDEQEGSTSYEYEYNENDFPTKCTKTYTNGSLSQETVIRFEYY